MGIGIDMPEEMGRILLEPFLQIRGDRQQSVRLEAKSTTSKLGYVGDVARLEKAPRINGKGEVDAALLEAGEEVIELVECLRSKLRRANLFHHSLGEVVIM